MAFDFEQENGREHPRRESRQASYTGLLAAMGKSQAEIATTVAELRNEAKLGQA